MTNQAAAPKKDLLFVNLSLDEIEERESQLKNSKWFIQQRDLLDLGQYPDRGTFMKNQGKKASFHAIVEKYCNGSAGEKKVLRSLRVDLFIRYSFLFNKRQFQGIERKGLQDEFADEINQYFSVQAPTSVIPQWAIERIKGIVEGNAEAAQLFRKGIPISSFGTTSLLTCSGLDNYSTHTPLPSTPSQHTESPASKRNEVHNGSASTQSEQLQTREYARNQQPPPEPQSLLPPSTGHILPPQSGYGILSSNTANTNAQIHHITSRDLPPLNPQLVQPVPTAEYNGRHGEKWLVSEQQFSQDLGGASYPTSVLPQSEHTLNRHSTTKATLVTTNTAGSDPFIHFSPDDGARKVQGTHWQGEKEGKAPKRRRLDPVPQAASWNDGTRPVNSVSVWDGTSVGNQLNNFTTAQVPPFVAAGLSQYQQGMSARL